jgi:hypothetical protein
MRRSMRGAVGAVASFAMLLAACTSDAPVATAPPVTLAPTTTATTSPPTTAPATTVEPATTPPTTALDDPARLRAAEAAYIASWEAYHAAILDPADPALREAIERTYTGGNLDWVLQTLDSYVDGRVVGLANAEVPAFALVTSSAKPIPDEENGVDLIACERNSESYVQLGAAPDGGDALIRDEIVVLRILVRLRLIDGEWRSESGETLLRQSGDVECSP